MTLPYPPHITIEPSLIDDTDAALLEAGRLLFARECNFWAGVDKPERLPEGALTEIAFAGRSNVGKSSLVNALTGRKTLARTSNTPGRTQQLNFFDLGGRLMLVDLPGYGYAKVSKTDSAAWTDLTRWYLKGRVLLRRVCLLVDGRHGLKVSDEATMKDLDNAAVPYQVVLTKGDKVKQAARPALIEATVAALKRHPAAHPHVLLTSSENGEGIPALRAALATLASPL